MNLMTHRQNDRTSLPEAHTLSTCACASALVLFALAAPATASTPLTVLGGDDSVWAFRTTEPDADGKSQVQFAYATPGKASMRFRSLLVDPVYGDIAISAVVGADLHVFFGDGSHYRFRPPPVGQPPGDVDSSEFHELTLPHNALPLALAGDDKADKLAAIVPAKAAVFPPEPLLDKWSDDDTTTQSADATKPDVATTGFALIEYTGNSWRYVAPLPDDFGTPAKCLVAAYDGQCHVVFTTPASPSQVLYLEWSAKKQRWSKPIQIPGIGENDLLALVATEKTTAVVSARDPKSGECTAEAIELLDDKWVEQAALQLVGKEAHFPIAAMSVHRFREDLVVAVASEEAGRTVVNVGFWPLAGGEAVHAPRPVRALAKLPDLTQRQRIHMFVATGVLVVSLVFVFMRRRDSFAKDCRVPPGYVLSTFGRRFAAIVVDMLIVSSFAAPLLFAPWLEKHGIPIDNNLWIELDNVYAQEPDAMTWLWLLTNSLFAVYCIVSEAGVGATPGKLLLGLRVCDENGNRPNLPAIIIRNVLRIELYFMLNLAPTAILAVLTRNRQRIGDLIARTVVVEKERPQLGAPPTSDD